MRILIVTDAWTPQVNGVVRTLQTTIQELESLGHQVRVVSPDLSRFWTFPLPTYPEIRLEFFSNFRLRDVLQQFAPDCIHIATEGPLGAAARAVCLAEDRPFTTAYHTCFPEYIAARVPRWFSPLARNLAYRFLKRFHAPSSAVMVATATIHQLLAARKFHNLKYWSRGVDLKLFRPQAKEDCGPSLKRPIFTYVGRIAVEKNLSAFLALDLPGSKMLIGDGPHRTAFAAEFPQAHFLGAMQGEALARQFAAADVFVFPSRTDTFGLVLLEALACGMPVAAYPVQGPRDVFQDPDAAAVAVLSDDLAVAARGALALAQKPETAASCRAYAEKFSWRASAEQFLRNLQERTPPALRRAARWRRWLSRWVSPFHRRSNGRGSGRGSA